MSASSICIGGDGASMPLELAESVLPTINKEHLHNGGRTISQRT